MTLRAKSPKHQGQAMVEFLIVMPVFILLIFGTVQVALIYSAKTTLNYATFQAARIGALNNATYTGIRKGLIRGLAPLFTNSNSRTGPDVSQDIAAGIDSGGSRKDAASEVDGYVRIIRVSPRAAIFSTGSSGFGELNSDGIAQIPNSQLMYRDSRLASNVNIQDANLLKIRVQYCYELIVPMVSRVIGSLSQLNGTRPASSYHKYENRKQPRFSDLNRGYANEAAAASRSLTNYSDLCGGRGGAENRAKNSNGFVISAEATVRMQSPAYEDDPNTIFGSYMCGGDRMSCP